MPASFDYVARETASNLWRNRLMTLAAVMTVAVSLSLVGAALLLKQGAAQAEQLWTRDTQVTVWMYPNASQAEINSIGVELKQMPLVTGCVFRNHQYDYLEAKKLGLGNEFSQAGLTPAQVPTSWRCTPTRLQDAQVVSSTIFGKPGVQKVSTPVKVIHTMETTITILQAIFISVAVVLILSAVVLILNTIRMAIFARRREVSVMKLVGATNWFIRIPFMSEGMAQGLVGSLVASSVVLGLHVFLNDLAQPNNPNSVLTEMRMTGWQLVGTDAVIVIVGIIIGSLGSAVAIRRFLDV